MNALTLDDSLRIIASIAVRTRKHFDLWWATVGASDRKPFAGAIDEYWEALRFLEHGQLVAIIVDGHLLLEQNPNHLSLHRLCKLVAADGGDTRLAEELIEAASPTATKFMILRHAAFAHRSAKLGYREVFVRAGITPDEMREHLERLHEIARQLLIARGLEPNNYDDLAQSTYVEMLTRLARDDPDL